MTTGVVPFQAPGFPEGAGSAKEAVMKQIENDNAAQQQMNETMGGGKKRSSMKRRRVGKSIRGKSNRRKSMKRVSFKRESKSRKSNRRKTFYGGEDALPAGEEVAVPQFGNSNSSGPLNPNAMSAGMNSLLLQTKQNAVHDSKINK